MFIEAVTHACGVSITSNMGKLRPSSAPVQVIESMVSEGITGLNAVGGQTTTKIKTLIAIIKESQR
jgi:hypothetical protein